jgi:hypothetical protein
MGSGIYSGKYGALNYTFDPESGTKLVIAEVPIYDHFLESKPIITRIIVNEPIVPKHRNSPKEFHSFLREDLQNYTTKILNLATGRNTENICTENGFCCSIEFELLNTGEFGCLDSTENYRLIAFNGTRTVAAKTSQFDWQVCGIARCLNGTLESCSENDKESSETNISTLRFLKLNATFNLHWDYTFLPGYSLLDVRMNLIPRQYFKTDLNLEERQLVLYSSQLDSVNVKTLAIINKIYVSG